VAIRAHFLQVARCDILFLHRHNFGTLLLSLQSPPHESTNQPSVIYYQKEDMTSVAAVAVSDARNRRMQRSFPIGPVLSCSWMKPETSRGRSSLRKLIGRALPWPFRLPTSPHPACASTDFHSHCHIGPSYASECLDLRSLLLNWQCADVNARLLDELPIGICRSTKI
jgi:hypothetical protein